MPRKKKYKEQREQLSCQSAGGGNKLPPVRATTREQNPLLLQRQKGCGDENPQIMKPIEKERRLDENKRQVELLIAIKKAIIERENKESPEENCDAETLKEYTILANYYRLDPKTIANYERKKQHLQCLEMIILEHTDKLMINANELNPYIEDYNIRVAEHKIRIETLLVDVNTKRQSENDDEIEGAFEDNSEEMFDIPRKLDNLLRNDIFKPGEPPITVRQLVGLEKKLNVTYTTFLVIVRLITALQQRQDRLSQKKDRTEQANPPKETGHSLSPTGVQEACAYLDNIDRASALADTDDLGRPPKIAKKQPPSMSGLFRVSTRGSLMSLADLSKIGDDVNNPCNR